MNQVSLVPPEIVVIDDSPTVCTILRVCLGRAGYRVTAYHDPLDALRVLFRAQVPLPALILVDIVLPRWSGFVTIQQIRANPHLQTIPILAMSGRTGVLDRLKARLAGANAYVPKPIQVTPLVELVQSYLSC